MKYIYGVDLGGTTVKMGLFDQEGNMLEKWEIVTRKENNGELILPDIAKAIADKNEEKSIDKSDIIGIGMGVPGPITEDGRVLKCANLGWGIFSVADELRKLTGTGVGGGIILNGKILTGSNGAAGEIGHLLVNPHEKRTCGCGKKGCLEQYSSATGITRMSKEKLEQTDTPSELRQYDHPITGLELFKAYKNNDALAKEIVDTFSSYLGKGLSHVAAVVDPQAFVIGGGVSKNGQIVLDVVQEKYEQDVMFALKGKEFRLAELGNDAGMYGGACAIMND